MKLDIGDLSEIREYLELGKLFKPIISDSIDVIQEYGPEIRKLFSGIVDGIVDMKIQAIKRYDSNGFSRTEAILLTIDSFSALSKLTDGLKDKKSGVK